MKLSTHYLYLQPELSQLQEPLLIDASKAFGRGQYELMYKKLICCTPSQDQLLEKWFLFALYYRAKKKYAEAIKCYLHGLKINPQDFRLLNNLSILYCLNNQNAKALQVICRALQLFPWLSFLRYQKGTSLLRMNHLIEAEQAFKECLECERSMLIDFLAKAKIAEIRKQQGLQAEAILIYQKLSLLPSHREHPLLEKSRQMLVKNDLVAAGDLMLSFYLNHNFEKMLPAQKSSFFRWYQKAQSAWAQLKLRTFKWPSQYLLDT